MCGIVGALDLTGKRTFSHERLLAMTQAIAHRGPDDEHIQIAPGFALGARRLAIIDLHDGRQPISNKAKNIWVAFNGELFDYPKLRTELLHQKHDLTTHCDTEAWLHLYEEYGEKMLDHAHGQFGVSLWDEREQLLILARDRVGICPLYYTIADGWLLWASEIKSLFASGLVTLKPDLKGIDHLFNFFCAGATRTFFEGITLIPPGHYLRVKNNEIRSHQYWDLNFPTAGEERKVQDPMILIEELDHLLNKAIKKRLHCDVPVVSYLSGGVDSSLILGLSCKLNKKPLPSFTIGLDKVGHNEQSEAAESANLFQSNLTTLRLNASNIAQAFPELILAAEGPILDTSCSALMQLASEVNNQGYKVALSGEGADEAFAGYFCFKSQKISEKVREWIGFTIPDMTRKLIQKSIQCELPSHLTPPKHNINQSAQQFLYETVGMARGSVYSNDMWENLNDHNPYLDLQITNNKIKQWHPLNQSLYVGYKVMLPGLLMISKGDRIAMRSSVEMRYPYLDEDIITFCASIDPSYKLRGLTEKWLLRQVAAKVLPTHIANRRKICFSTSLSRIFLSKDRPAWVDQLLSPESLKKSGYFDPTKVINERKLQARFPNIMPRQFVLDATLTTVISTQLWHHTFFGELCDLPVWNRENK
jgi:asparagine synthase (glutamine-hydrolysing)